MITECLHAFKRAHRRVPRRECFSALFEQLLAFFECYLFSRAVGQILSRLREDLFKGWLVVQQFRRILGKIGSDKVGAGL